VNGWPFYRPEARRQELGKLGVPIMAHMLAAVWTLPVAECGCGAAIGRKTMGVPRKW
jgi:hypothetical protein